MNKKNKHKWEAKNSMNKKNKHKQKWESKIQ